MDEEILEGVIENMPDLAAEVLSAGRPATYESDEYPWLLLEEFPDGRLHSIDVDLETGESIVLEVLRKANKYSEIVFI